MGLKIEALAGEMACLLKVRLTTKIKEKAEVDMVAKACKHSTCKEERGELCVQGQIYVMSSKPTRAAIARQCLKKHQKKNLKNLI